MNEITVVNTVAPLSNSIIENMTLANAKDTLDKINAFHAIVNSTLKPNIDYGIIPGTAKPTLLKPGAETICMMFGLTNTIEVLSAIPQALSKTTDFVAYTVKCKLYKNETLVSEGVGTCNSQERKYQKAGALDIANTVLKMAEKRALVDATLHVASLSAVFTQDIEDMQDYMQREAVENMTVEDASNFKINFGKHKGKTAGEVYKTAFDYVTWFMESGKDEKLKKAFEVLGQAVADSKKAKTEVKQEEDIGKIFDDAEAMPPWEEKTA